MGYARVLRWPKIIYAISPKLNQIFSYFYLSSQKPGFVASHKKSIDIFPKHKFDNTFKTRAPQWVFEENIAFQLNVILMINLLIKSQLPI